MRLLDVAVVRALLQLNYKKLGINYKKISNYYLIKGLGPNGFNTNKKISPNAGNSGTFARLILGLLVNANNEIKII